MPAKAFESSEQQLIESFPKPLSKSTWNKSNKGFDEGSKPYQLNALFREFGLTEAEIIARLGAPIKRTETLKPNLHEPEYNNAYVQLFYHGLTIEVFTTHHPRTFVNKLIISNCDLSSQFQQYLCKSPESVKELLGEPSAETLFELVYFINFGVIGTVPMRLAVNDGQVTSIYVSNFVD